MVLLDAMIRSSKVLCKASTNVPGDVPSTTTTTGMSQYERIIEMLTTLFPLWVCLAIPISAEFHYLIYIMRAILCERKILTQ